MSNLNAPEISITFPVSNRVTVTPGKPVVFQNSADTIVVNVARKNTSGVLNVSVKINNGEILDKVLVAYGDVTETVDVSNFLDVPEFRVDVTAIVSLTTWDSDAMSNYSICEVTESVKNTTFTAASVLPLPYVDQKKDSVPTSVLLKAFCNFPGASATDTSTDFSNVYLAWEESSDGVYWNGVSRTDSADLEGVTATLLPEALEGSLEDPVDKIVQRTFYRLKASGPNDSISYRPDVLPVQYSTDSVSKSYRVRVSILQKADDTYSEKFLLNLCIFTPIFSNNYEVMRSSINCASKSLSLFYNRRLYGYGNPEFKNNIVVSSPGETVRPLSDIVELNVSDNSLVTALVPWKSDVIAFTEYSAHLVQRDDIGFKSSTVNSFIGIPLEDRRTVKNMLNGIIFKSGTKVYILYPNVYSGSDSVLNLSDISTPIEDYLIEYGSNSEYTPFALSTESAYMLFMPKENCTVCLKYEYTQKRWCMFEYPIVLLDYEMLSVSDIRVTGYNPATGAYAEYSIEQNLFDGEGVYGDKLSDDDKITPIEFELDSGQKTDNPVTDKMFTETKFIVATLHEQDAFPMEIKVHVDGTPRIVERDINTDSAFWTSQDSAGVLSTDFTTNDTDLFNVIRQMFIRYSGKGKSVRHIISGKSLYPFKLYEILYRFRNLNTKQ